MYQEEINTLTALCTDTVDICISNKTQVPLSNYESDLVFNIIQLLLENRTEAKCEFKHPM